MTQPSERSAVGKVRGILLAIGYPFGGVVEHALAALDEVEREMAELCTQLEEARKDGREAAVVSARLRIVIGDDELWSSNLDEYNEMMWKEESKKELRTRLDEIRDDLRLCFTQAIDAARAEGEG